MPYKDPEVKRAKGLEYSRAWRERNRDALNEQRREHYATDPAYRAATFVKPPKHVHAAHMRVYKAIKRGEITRPDICSECGARAFVEAAHENYAERLAIRWLCRSCHREWDAAHPKTEEAPEAPAFKPLRKTKVTEADVTEMRAEYANGISQVALSKRFGISRAQVGNIVRGESWS